MEFLIQSEIEYRKGVGEGDTDTFLQTALQNLDKYNVNKDKE